MNWTQEEDQKLVDIINRNIYRNSKRPIQWKKIRPMKRHTTSAMQTRWAKYIQPNYNFNGYRYVSKGSTLFIEPKPLNKKTKTRTIYSNKRIKVSRSFLWGALKVTRYE